MVTSIIKKIFLVSFIFLNIQKIQPFCCCSKADSIIDTRFNAQQDSHFLQNRTESKKSLIDTVRSQPANNSYQIDEQTEKQDYNNNPIHQAQDQNNHQESTNVALCHDLAQSSQVLKNHDIIENYNNGIKYSRIISPEEVVLSSLGKIAANDPCSQNIIESNNQGILISTNPALRTEFNQIEYSPVDENIQPNAECSLFNVEPNPNRFSYKIDASYTDQSNSQREVVIPLSTQVLSYENITVENSNTANHLGTFNRCYDPSKNQNFPKGLFPARNSNDGSFNSLDSGNAMPHQVGNDDTPESSHRN